MEGQKRNQDWWQRQSPLIKILVAGVALLFTVTFLQALFVSPPTVSSSKESFFAVMAQVHQHKVTSLTIDDNSYSLQVVPKSGTSYLIGVPGNAGISEVVATAKKAGVPLYSVPLHSGSLFGSLLTYLPTLLVIGLILFMINMYRPKRKPVEPQQSTVSFADVAGCDEAIADLREIGDFLRDPDRYRALGARVPKGVLLYGPPGTGKTLLAKALAADAGVPFFSVAGSEFVEMIVGLGANRVRGLFKQAKKVAPAIIFIDELDAVGRSRSITAGDGATRESDQTLNQLLAEMDGFSASEFPVIVIGASNRKEVLDPALLRAGRFDREISVPPPDRRGREAILEIHARNKRLAEDVDLSVIAANTVGMTGADLENILNEAALLTARQRAEVITQSNIEAAFQRVMLGVRKETRVFSDKERKTIAYHEAGHALVAELLPGADNVHGISIIPHGDSGGHTLQLPDDDHYLLSREQLADRLAVYLGGRAAEELIFGAENVTTGASDDLRQASHLARQMLTRLGLGETLGLAVVEDPNYLGLAQPLSREIEAELQQLLDGQYKRALSLLRRKRAALNRVAEALLVEETLDRDRFGALLSGRTKQKS